MQYYSCIPAVSKHNNKKIHSGVCEDPRFPIYRGICGERHSIKIVNEIHLIEVYLGLLKEIMPYERVSVRSSHLAYASWLIAMFRGSTKKSSFFKGLPCLQATTVSFVMINNVIVDMCNSVVPTSALFSLCRRPFPAFFETVHCVTYLSSKYHEMLRVITLDRSDMIGSALGSGCRHAKIEIRTPVLLAWLVQHLQLSPTNITCQETF